MTYGDLAQQFFRVSAAWNGRGERMTTNHAIRTLTTVAEQATLIQNPVLARRARLLLDQIVYGRNYRPERLRGRGVNRG